MRELLVAGAVALVLATRPVESNAATTAVTMPAISVTGTPGQTPAP